MKKSSQGFTLMEIILVLGLLGIIFAFTAFITFDTYRGSSFRNERDTIIGTLQRARTESMNNVCAGSCTNSKPHGVYFTSTSYTLFQGATYASRDIAYDEVRNVPTGVQLHGLQEVIFSLLSGDATTTPSGSFDLVIQDSTGHISTTTINKYGQITWTN
jgi:prepilin-type N-terminal cleavage/methylation domain-containing protein